MHVCRQCAETKLWIIRHMRSGKDDNQITIKSRTTSDNVHIIHICPDIRICSDNMKMTCTYANNSSRNEMYIIYASVDNIQMISKMCMSGDNMYRN